jgi:hypothetical protein
MSIAFHRGMNAKDTIGIEARMNGEQNAMIPYSMFDQDVSFGCTDFNAAKRRYAWLEQEGNMWHFLTNLFADPTKSTRKWSNKQRALDELTREGWTVLYPYPEQGSKLRSAHHNACGYGLMWIDQ